MKIGATQVGHRWGSAQTRTAKVGFETVRTDIRITTMIHVFLLGHSKRTSPRHILSLANMHRFDLNPNRHRGTLRITLRLHRSADNSRIPHSDRLTILIPQTIPHMHLDRQHILPTGDPRHPVIVFSLPDILTVVPTRLTHQMQTLLSRHRATYRLSLLIQTRRILPRSPSLICIPAFSTCPVLPPACHLVAVR
jgi:hypothetical protein